MSRERRLHRTQQRLHGTRQRPRLCVNVSNRHIQAQLIDDDRGHTLAYSTSQTLRVDGNMQAKAQVVGSDIAKKARDNKVERVVFDRRHKPYHGRVAAVADAAREKGLEF